MNEKLRILIVEDEEPIRKGLVDLFIFHGYDVESCSCGSKGLELGLSGQFDLIVLDVMLPNLDGYSICNALREKSRSQAIILLTAKASEEDIINGLTLGADDYVTKPFSVRQLVLRAEAVLRRSVRAHALQRTVQLTPGVTIDTEALLAEISGQQEHIALSRKEVEILCYLHYHRDRPISREELLSEVWGYARAELIETRTVDIHIAKLRRKIERDAKNPTLLLTVRGEGYQLAQPGK